MQNLELETLILAAIHQSRDLSIKLQMGGGLCSFPVAKKLMLRLSKKNTRKSLYRRPTEVNKVNCTMDCTI